MDMVQCRLKQNNTTMITWLAADKLFKVGDSVTLKGLGGKWLIESMGAARSSDNINRGWNNNI